MEIQIHRVKKCVVLQLQLDRVHANVICTVTSGDFERKDIKVDLLAGEIPARSSEEAIRAAFTEFALNNKEKIKKELGGCPL